MGTGSDSASSPVGSAAGAGLQSSSRQIDVGDLGKLLEHRNRSSTLRWLGRAKPLTQAEHERWFVSLADSKDSIYRIAQLETNVFDGEGNVALDVGLIRVTCINRELNSACVGCDVYEEHRGRGVGKKVFAEAVRLAEEALAPNPNLYLWVFMENIPAVSIYAKAGFIFDPDAPTQTYLRDSGFVNYVRMVRPIGVKSDA